MCARLSHLSIKSAENENTKSFWHWKHSYTYLLKNKKNANLAKCSQRTPNWSVVQPAKHLVLFFVERTDRSPDEKHRRWARRNIFLSLCLIVVFSKHSAGMILTGQNERLRPTNGDDALDNARWYRLWMTHRSFSTDFIRSLARSITRRLEEEGEENFVFPSFCSIAMVTVQWRSNSVRRSYCVW